HGESSPNMDAAVWFSREILPVVREKSGRDVRLVIAGVNDAESARRLEGESVEVLRKVDDLTPLYDRARLFVAPTRFASGIPLKVYEAAAARRFEEPSDETCPATVPAHARVVQ